MKTFLLFLCQKIIAFARYCSDGKIDGFVGEVVAECKYGENAWQAPAALLRTASDSPLALHRFILERGSTPSYNNYCDMDRLLQTITHIAAAFEWNGVPVPRIAVVAKHGNPCGAATGKNSLKALQKMILGDKTAIFGGVVMVNFPIDESEAEVLRSHGMEEGKTRFLVGVIAPVFSKRAVEIFGGSEKGGCMLLSNPSLSSLGVRSLDRAMRFRYTAGGMLRQPNYTYVPDLMELGVADKLGPLSLKGMLLAWAVAATCNSNTIIIVKDEMVVGRGIGQQDRIGAAALALTLAARGGHDVHEAIACSDSFFPHPDAPTLLLEAGVKAVLTTSGSKKDDIIRKVFPEPDRQLFTVLDAEGRGFFGH